MGMEEISLFVNEDTKSADTSRRVTSLISGYPTCDVTNIGLHLKAQDERRGSHTVYRSVEIPLPPDTVGLSLWCTNWVKLAPKWDKCGTFKDQFQYILVR